MSTCFNRNTVVVAPTILSTWNETDSSCTVETVRSASPDSRSRDQPFTCVSALPGLRAGASVASAWIDVARRLTRCKSVLINRTATVGMGGHDAEKWLFRVLEINAGNPLYCRLSRTGSPVIRPGDGEMHREDESRHQSATDVHGWDGLASYSHVLLVALLSLP